MWRTHDHTVIYSWLIGSAFVLYTLLNGARHIVELARVESHNHMGKKRYYVVISALPVITAINAYASLICLRKYPELTFVTDMFQARGRRRARALAPRAAMRSPCGRRLSS